MKTLYVDVREPDEFKRQHLKESVNIPLSVFQSSVDAVRKMAEEFKVVLICQSGTRAGNASCMLGSNENIEVFEGGLNKWQESDKVVEGEKSGVISIMRQVMIVAGFLVLLGCLGAQYIQVNLIWLSVFVGAGLMFAGVSGICLMAQLLSKMPWNK